MIPREETAIHQLLGRIVYLHALFIEPHIPMTRPRVSVERVACCNHTAQAEPMPPWSRSSGSAWTVLLEVADTLPDTSRCRQVPDGCCAACVVATSAATIVQWWVDVEQEAYGQTDMPRAAEQVWARAAGTRLARVFARQHGTDCRALAADLKVVEDPSPDVLALTGELFALWANPAGADQAPVVSWLNHCAGLADVARIVDSRRTTA